MKFQLFVFFLNGCFLLSHFPFVWAEEVELAEGLQVSQLTESIWLHTSSTQLEGFGRVVGNGLIVAGNDEAALIDTPWTDEQVRLLFDWTKRSLGQSIKMVVPTHSHGDCMGGLAAAHELGARSVALDRTRIIAAREGLPVPQGGFEGKTTLEVGGRQISVRFVGPGHTVDNVIVWIADEKVMFGGCLVKSAESSGMGYIGESDLSRWPATISVLESQYEEGTIIVPGHGRPGGRELLQHTKELIEGYLEGQGSSGSDLSSAEILSGIEDRIQRYRTVGTRLVLLGEGGKPVETGSRFRVQQTGHAFLFGSNIFQLGRSQSDRENELYRQRFAELFNFATLPFYWWSYEAQQGVTRAARIEEILSWCEDHGIKAKGHTLAWNFVDPKWLPRDAGEARRLQLDRILQIVRRFLGRIDTWDVVNEPTEYSRSETEERSPILTNMISEMGVAEYLKQAFSAARAANPDAVLIINDYKTGAEYQDLIRSFLDTSEHPPLFDVIGIQSHQHREAWSLGEIWDVCERFAELGEPLHFTEVTFLSGQPGWYLKRSSPEFDWVTNEQGEERQKEEVELFYRILFSHPAVEAITWWDFSDQGAWQGAPAGLLREDMSPKPAYEALYRLIKKEWWTELQGIVGQGGEVLLTGFQGDYEVAVRDEGTEKRAAFRLTVDSPTVLPLEVK